jgi:hypothetical protein
MCGAGLESRRGSGARLPLPADIHGTAGGAEGMGPNRRLRFAAWAMAVGAALAALLCACASRTTTTGAAAGAPAPTATPAPNPSPAPAARVPDQPYVGTPRPVEQRYLEIIRLKNRGQTNEELLAKVLRENVVYSLSTFDIQKLRAAGVSEEVIAAMLASGREGRTPTPTPRGS